MTFLRLLLALTSLYTMFICASDAQAQERLPLNGYAIEITYKDGKSSHSPMFGQELRGNTGFTLSPWNIIKRANKDSEQVSMVLVAAAFDGGAWRIKVSVRKGEFYDKGEQEVATYSVRENEKATVKEMEQFGVEPFDVSVVRVNQAAANQPEIRNKTKSIEVMRVEATTVPSPYRLSLRNLSDKPVLALEVNSYSGDQMLFLTWPQGTWDSPLIEPGGACEVGMTSQGRGEATTYGYVPEQSTSIEINTVVFEDGSYEGAPYLAAVTRGQMMGSKAQLGRILPLLQAALESTDGARVSALLDVKERVLAISEEVETARLKELEGQFPNLNVNEKENLPNFIKFGLHYVKTTLVKEIDAFEKGGRQINGSLVREWLVKTKERYEKWLSAL
jgi:hypothetical protein